MLRYIIVVGVLLAGCGDGSNESLDADEEALRKRQDAGAVDVGGNVDADGNVALGESSALALSAGSPTVFAGPFPSWINVKTRFGAKGDGVADDTTAVQNALSSAASPGQPYVVYFPAGTYRITRTLTIKYKHMVVYGEDPATTKLSWAGSSGADMIRANGASWSIMGRLTFEGNGVAGGGLHFLWDDQGPGEYSTQGVSLIDLVFRRMGKGIIGGAPSPGNMDSDIGIFRTRFESCSVAGLSTESCIKSYQGPKTGSSGKARRAISRLHRFVICGRN